MRRDDPRFRRAERLLSELSVLLQEIRLTPPPVTKKGRGSSTLYERSPLRDPAREANSLSGTEREPSLPKRRPKAKPQRNPELERRCRATIWMRVRVASPSNVPEWLAHCLT
jgi:hypothetical protein